MHDRLPLKSFSETRTAWTSLVKESTLSKLDLWNKALSHANQITNHTAVKYSPPII